MCLAIPGRILEIVDEPNRLAKVDVAGVQRTINVGLLDADGDSAGVEAEHAHRHALVRAGDAVAVRAVAHSIRLSLSSRSSVSKS